MAVKSLKISVERLLEQEVEEITRSGEEKYVQTRNMSEELTYLAGKIDFYEGINSLHNADEIESEKENKDKIDSDDKDNKEDTKPEVWHWLSVHSKLRIALSEVCVMLDVLQTLNKKKYLILDPIQQLAEPDKQTVQMLEKRKILAKAGSIIAKGAIGIKLKQNDVPSKTIVIDGNEGSDYYRQLIELRQFWRVKKSGSQITGDLSYRSSGSKFWHPGMFEVTTAQNVDDEDIKTLSINISPDLVKESEIAIEIKDNNNNKFSWNSETVPVILEDNFVNPWEKDMSKAQQHLFNKEIFSQLSNDAFQGSFIGLDVLNSQIRCKILDGVSLTISHLVDVKQPERNSSNHFSHLNDLKLFLNSLLYQQHRKNSFFSTPYPSTSNFFGKQSKSSSVINIFHRSYDQLPQSILKEFLKHAEHKIWIQRIDKFLHRKCLEVFEPLINYHWSILNSRLKSVVNVILSTLCLGKPITSNFMICINHNQMIVYSEDNSSVSLPMDMGTLNCLIETQIYNHIQLTVKEMCRLYGWSVVESLPMGKSVLSSSQYIGAPIVIKNYKKNKTVKLWFNGVCDVTIEYSKDSSDYSKNKLLDTCFEYLKRPFFNIPWNALPGNFLVEKLESLLLF